jgi:hypothetical protein
MFLAALLAERRARENALQESENQLRLFVEHTPAKEMGLLGVGDFATGIRENLMINGVN